MVPRFFKRKETPLTPAGGRPGLIGALVQYGGFHKWWYPQNGCFIVENTIQIDDLGVPQFQETSISVSTFSTKMRSQRSQKQTQERNTHDRIKLLGVQASYLPIYLTTLCCLDLRCHLHPLSHQSPNTWLYL